MAETDAARYRYPFSPYPEGWYQVGWADDLAPGSLQPVRAFGQDLVLFRSESGRAALVDAHCPHMGAHLGEGGSVVGESLRCPFHHWRFGTDGVCVEAPYERRGRAPATSVRSWPLHESAGLLLAGYTPNGAEPSWRMEDIPEFEDDAWFGYEKRSYRIRMHVQELAENVPDRAHFLYVHETGVVPDVHYETDGPVYRQRTTLDYGNGTSMNFHQRCYGLGLIWLLNADTPLQSLFLTATTPVDEQHADVRVSYLFKGDGPDAGSAQYLDMMDQQFAMDGRIWEHKVYREKPHLIDGDGPIGELRRWATQFYPEAR